MSTKQPASAHNAPTLDDEVTLALRAITEKRAATLGYLLDESRQRHQPDDYARDAIRHYGRDIGRSVRAKMRHGHDLQEFAAVFTRGLESRVRPRFILRWVQGLNRSLLGIWAKEGATVESLEHEYVANTRLPLPDLKEQDAILATLDLETARIDALISKSEQSIILLKERRAAFITAAVTGQIDLRGKQ